MLRSRPVVCTLKRKKAKQGTQSRGKTNEGGPAPHLLADAPVRLLRLRSRLLRLRARPLLLRTKNILRAQ